MVLNTKSDKTENADLNYAAKMEIQKRNRTLERTEETIRKVNLKSALFTTTKLNNNENMQKMTKCSMETSKIAKNYDINPYVSKIKIPPKDISY